MKNKQRKQTHGRDSSLFEASSFSSSSFSSSSSPLSSSSSSSSSHEHTWTLLQLQNALKRDPESYRAEMLVQWRHHEAMTQVLLLQPADSGGEDYGAVTLFLCQVAHCYRLDLAPLAPTLMRLLSVHADVLAPPLRRTLVQGLILLRNKQMVPPEKVLSLCFELFRCKDKSLREMLCTYIVNDIKTSNQKHKNQKLNSVLQNFMFTMLTDANEIAARKSLEVLIRLYRKNVWNDAKTVNVISTACFSASAKMVVMALKFFLGADNNNNKEHEDSDDESDVESAMDQVKSIGFSNKVGRKSLKKEKKLLQAKKKLEKKSKSHKKQASFVNFSAIQLIHDPQGFSEKLMSKMKSGNPKPTFEVQLLMMNLTSRMIGIHQLILLEFYSSLQNYLQPWQKEVTSILAFLVQACHSLVPPDALEQPLRCICNKFVSDHCSSEVITVGLNAIREICSRCPHVMTASLLQDLVQYKNFHDKGVVMAARSLLALYREVNPTLLAKKDRGKIAQQSINSFKETPYGATTVATGVEGAELLENDEEEESVEDDDDNEEWEEVSSSDEEDDEDEEEDEDEKEDEDDEQEEEENTDEAAESGKSRVDHMKILSEEDFAKIRKLKAKQELQKLAGTVKGPRKRTIAELELEDSDLEGSGEEDSDDDEVVSSGDEESRNQSGNIVPPESLFAGAKSRKATYEERMRSIMNGREGREKFGSKKGLKERYSKTNKEKSKEKNFRMMRYKREVREKAKLSLPEKKARQQAHVKRMKMNRGHH